MNNLKVLDCTLRDGGYVNDWCFGRQAAKEIVESVSSSGADYVELGFIRNCDYEAEKMQFSRMSQVTDLFRPSAQRLAVMVEIGYGYPVELFPRRSSETADLVRVIVWKRMIRESIEYCRRLKDLGYEVGVQATRTDQYTETEFAEFAEAFSNVNPDFLYIVDTFGLMDREMVLRYAEIADRHLGKDISLGYHAHNNLQQAFANVVAFLEHPWSRDVIVDASMMGIGRSAGNLCLELLYRYLKDQGVARYDETCLYDALNDWIQPIYERTPWGYSVPHFLSAVNGCNPTFVKLARERGLRFSEMAKVFSTMYRKGCGIRFDPADFEKAVEELRRNG